MKSKLIKTIKIEGVDGLVDVMADSESSCEDCMFDIDDCPGHKLGCIENECYYVKHKITEKWIQCTPENIKSGDTVRARWNNDTTALDATVGYIFSDGKRFVDEYDDGSDGVANIKDYKKLILI